MTEKKLRYDIAWLRSIAVIFVVLYHFKTPYFNGGFVGVDIFFVISGFLMTGIVLNKYKFSTLIDFYISRFLRIVPALCFLVLAMLAVGYFILTTERYENLSINAMASLLFFSNKYYALHSGYFDSSSENNFFLHTWSLSVEWQFYLLYPLLVLFIQKIKAPFKISILILLGISFLPVSLGLVSSQEEIFYSLLSRSWELLSGGVAYIYSANHEKIKYKKILSFIGACLIIVSVINISSKDSWPNIYTTFPIAGAVIIILSNNQESLIIKNRVFQYIGTISYSLYLWHWPVIVLMRYYNLKFTFLSIFSGIITSFLLAIVSFYLVESPLRNRKKLKKNIIGGISVIILCSFVLYTNGIRFRLSSDIKDIASYRFESSEWRPDTCFLNPGQDYKKFKNCEDKMTRNSIVVWGDSHAAHLMPGLRRSFNVSKLTQRTSSLCGPLQGAENKQRTFCKDINTHVLNEIVSVKPQLVIMSALWSQYPFDDYLADTLRELRDSGIRVIVIGPFPFWGKPLPEEIEIHGLNAQRNLPTKLFERNKLVFYNDKKIRSIVERDGNAKYISALEVLCDKYTCKVAVDESPVRPIQWDNAHLTNSGSQWFINKIKDKIN